MKKRFCHTCFLVNFAKIGTKIWSKINPSIKNVKTLCSFMYALKKNIYYDCKHELIQIITTVLWSILSLYSLIATLLLLVIIGIFSSRRSSHFNLVFSPVFSYIMFISFSYILVFPYVLSYTYIHISYIHISIHPSIHPSIHTYIHTCIDCYYSFCTKL